MVISLCQSPRRGKVNRQAEVDGPEWDRSHCVKQVKTVSPLDRTLRNVMMIFKERELDIRLGIRLFV